MKKGNVIQVFRCDSRSTDVRIVKTIWEIGAASSTNVLVSIVTQAYVDGSDDTYEVRTIVDGVIAHTRTLCWDVPNSRCRKERVCVVIPEENRLQDLRAYCQDFLS